MLYDSNLILILCIGLCTLSCKDESAIKNNTFNAQAEGDDVLVGFSDIQRPAILAKTNCTFINNGEFQACIKHENSEYNGNFLTIPSKGISIHDENADGFPDLYKDTKTGKQWSLSWDFTSDPPTVKFVNCAANN